MSERSGASNPVLRLLDRKSVFIAVATLCISLKRIRRYDYLYMTTYYAINAATMLLFSRTLRYPQVR